MNDNTQTENVKNEPISGQTRFSGKRRMLVKGAIGAAPAILTLRSGTAFALDSAALCVARDASNASQQPPPILSPNDTDDVWLRKEVWCRTLTREKGSGSDTITVYNEIEDAETDWQHKDYTGTSSGEIGLYEEFTYNGAKRMRLKGLTKSKPRYTFTDSEQCYVLVHVDETGVVIEGSYGKAASGTPYITQSCWASAIGGSD